MAVVAAWMAAMADAVEVEAMPAMEEATEVEAAAVVTWVLAASKLGDAAAFNGKHDLSDYSRFSRCGCNGVGDNCIVKQSNYA